MKWKNEWKWTNKKKPRRSEFRERQLALKQLAMKNGETSTTNLNRNEATKNSPIQHFDISTDFASSNDDSRNKEPAVAIPESEAQSQNVRGESSGLEPLPVPLPLPIPECEAESNVFGGDLSEFAAFETEDDEKFYNAEGGTPLLGEEISGSSFSTYLNEPLCKCTKTTVGEVLFMVLTMGMRFSLPWIAQVAILKLVNTCLGVNKILASKYHLMKHLNSVGKDTTDYHIFCSNCGKYIGKKENLPDEVVCDCEKEILIKSTDSFFLTFSIESQVKRLLDNHQIAEWMTTYRFRRPRKENVYSDIYDGAQYQKLYQNKGVLSSPHNFSYNIFTDGISMGNASRKTIWPIYLTLNELPPRERSKCLILAGLYCGDKEPNQEAFLQPFVGEANILSTSGFEWGFKGIQIRSLLIPLCFIADSVARYTLLSFSHFNHRYGCTYCYQKTEHTCKGSRYLNLTTKSAERSKKSTLDDLKELGQRLADPECRETKDVRGVQGSSPLLDLLYFDFLWACPVDFMHCILLGVVSKHFDLILEATRKEFWIGMTSAISVKHLIGVVDDRLAKLKPPKFISRLPRGLKDVAQWKANEFRTWILFYALPCLRDLLKPKHFYHLCMLSKALFLLLQSSITREDVNEAQYLLISYSFYFEKYFGEDQMVYNVHLLKHIPKCVLNFGPLWTHNSFPYEGKNRYLLQLYQSPFQVPLQISRKFLAYSKLPILYTEWVENKNVSKFAEELLEQKLTHFKRCENVVLYGKSLTASASLLDSEKRAVTELGFSVAQCDTYNKVFFNGFRLTNSQYSANKRNNDSVVSTTTGSIAQIYKIVSCGENVFFIVKKFTIEKHYDIKFNIADKCVKIPHLQYVSEPGQYTPSIILSTDVETVCMCMPVSTGNFVVSKMMHGCKED